MNNTLQVTCSKCSDNDVYLGICYTCKRINDLYYYRISKKLDKGLTLEQFAEYYIRTRYKNLKPFNPEVENFNKVLKVIGDENDYYFKDFNIKSGLVTVVEVEKGEQRRIRYTRIKYAENNQRV